MEPELAKDVLDIAVQAARAAGRKAMEESKYIKSSIKNNTELVTTADSLCQELIINKIKPAFPDSGFIAEEGKDGKMLFEPPRSGNSFWWAIDPIDGTNNYAHGLPYYSVSIAAFYNHMPIAGVVFEPATDSMFTASQQTAAQLNNSPINTGDEQISRFASFGINSDFRPEHIEAINEMMRRTRARNIGSTALHLAYIARGAFVGTMVVNAKLWDWAAGAYIAEKAGAAVTDLTGKKLFPAELENYTGSGTNIIAANPVAHPQLLKLFSK